MYNQFSGVAKALKKKGCCNMRQAIFFAAYYRKLKRIHCSFLSPDLLIR